MNIRLAVALLSLIPALPSLAEPLHDDQGFIDGVRLDRLFSAAMTAFEREGQCVSGEELVRQMREEARFGLELSAAAADAPALAGEELFRRRAESVVGVGTTFLCGRCDNPHARLAGGVIVGSEGFILTNAHVVEGAEKAEGMGVVTYDGRVFPVRAVLAASKRDDIALLKVDAEGLPAAPVARTVAVGEGVAVISHPAQHYFVFTQGVVSSKLYRRAGHGAFRQLAITADFAKGSSGSPIFNRRGEVVGLVHATSTVHYNEGHGSGVPENVQMVWKYCVPYTSILDLLAPEEVDGEAEEAGP